MLVNYQTIKTDLQTEKANIFISEFPELKDAITQFKTKPSCSSCETSVISRILSHPSVNNKLKLIYGDDTQIDARFPVAPVWEQVSNVYNIPIDQYDTWFKEFSKVTPSQQIRIFSTTYNPDNKSMVVSVFGMKQKV